MAVFENRSQQLLQVKLQMVNDNNYSLALLASFRLVSFRLIFKFLVSISYLLICSLRMIVCRELVR